MTKKKSSKIEQPPTRDTETTQGHDLVFLVVPHAVAWVFWRWGRPVGFGMHCGYFGPGFKRDEENEKRDEEVMGGFSSWVIVDVPALDAVWLGSDPQFARSEFCRPARASDARTFDEMTDQSLAMLEQVTKHKPPDIIRRVISESHCIGIAVKEDDEGET